VCLEAVSRCIGAFFAEVKHNTSIVDASIDLWGVSVGDLSEFIVNNKTLEILSLSSVEPVSLEQSAALSKAIDTSRLKEVNIIECRFEKNGSFERLLEGCFRVNRFKMECRNFWQCAVLSALLRNSANVVRELGLILSFLSVS
jgi:hypothetical protein